MRLLLSLLLLAGTTPPTKPDLTGVVQLIGMDSMAQGCPVSPFLLLTSRHVALEHSRDGTVGQGYAVWSDQQGHSGSVWTKDYDLRRDLATMQSDQPFSRPYAVTEKAPAIGTQVVVVGFDFANRLSPKVIHTKVVNIIAAHVILEDADYGQGFSGSCVLDTTNHVVAIFQWTVSKDGGHVLGVASGVWGSWRDVSWEPPVLKEP